MSHRLSPYTYVRLCLCVCMRVVLCFLTVLLDEFIHEVGYCGCGHLLCSRRMNRAHTKEANQDDSDREKDRGSTNQGATNVRYGHGGGRGKKKESHFSAKNDTHQHTQSTRGDTQQQTCFVYGVSLSVCCLICVSPVFLSVVLSVRLCDWLAPGRPARSRIRHAKDDCARKEKTLKTRKEKGKLKEERRKKGIS